jgi:hypothetical protein
MKNIHGIRSKTTWFLKWGVGAQAWNTQKMSFLSLMTDMCYEIRSMTHSYLYLRSKKISVGSVEYNAQYIGNLQKALITITVTIVIIIITIIPPSSSLLSQSSSLPPSPSSLPPSLHHLHHHHHCSNHHHHLQHHHHHHNYPFIISLLNVKS